MGYCYEGRKLVCDMCGEAGARKRPCPAKVTYPGGYKLPVCPAAALCRNCNAEVRANGRWKAAHADCYKRAVERTAEEAYKAEKLAAGEFLRSSAVSAGENADGATLVRVTFTNNDGAQRHALMLREVYRAIPLGKPATVADFGKLGVVAL